MLAETLFVLVGCHCLCDFALQNDTMSREKHRSSTTPLQASVPWYYWLTAHSFIHGLSVFLVLHSLPLALAETVAHFSIDFGKCERKYGLVADQTMHVVCKLLWCLAAAWLV